MSNPSDPYGSSSSYGAYGQQPSGSSGSSWTPGQNQPYGGSNQPTVPSRPIYGAPSGPAQPPYGQGSGQMWGAPQTTPGGAPTWPGQAYAGGPPPTRKSRKGLWITLGVIAAVLVVGCSGVGFAFYQFLAPATAAGEMCGFFKTQNYTAGYTLLSANLRAQISADQFAQTGQALDQIEGKVQSCGQATGGTPYQYSLGSSTASVTVVIARATAGNMQGVIHLKNESGGWKVDGLDAGLLGVSLGALEATNTFCNDLKSQNYSGAYSLLGNAVQSTVKSADFIQSEQIHDQLDGSVSACALTGLAQGNTESNAGLTVSIERSKLGEKQGGIRLAVEGDAWKIVSIDAPLQGSDIRPVQVASQLCAAVMSGNLNQAYQTLTSSGLKANATADQFSAFFALNSGDKYTGCTPDFTTYKVASSGVTFDDKFGIQFASGQSVEVPVSLTFVLEQGTWKLQYLTTKNA